MHRRITTVILTAGPVDPLKRVIEGIETPPEGVKQAIVVIERGEKKAQEYLLSLGDDVEAFHVEDESKSFADIYNAATLGREDEFIWVLRADTVPDNDALQHMLKAMDDNPRVGIVGCKSYWREKKIIQHLGYEFDNWGIPSSVGYKRDDDEGFLAAHRDDKYQAIQGNSMLVRRRVWDELNGFDTIYHSYFEDVDFCLRAREKGWYTMLAVNAQVIHFEEHTAIYRPLPISWHGRNLKVFRDEWIDTGRLEKTLDIRLNRGIGPLMFERLNIGYVAAGDSGIAWWRMQLPAQKLMKKELVNIHNIVPTDSEQNLMETLEHADAAVFQGWSSQAIKQWADMKDARSWRMIYEFDDHPIYLSPFAMVYRSMGTQEIEIKSADGARDWLWRDGTNGFDLERNRENRQRHLEIIAACDAVQTTTPNLAEYFTSLNPEVGVLPNCIDFDWYPPLYDYFEKKPGPTRIGWWGGDNHWHDVSIIGPWLSEYVNNNDVKFVVIGSLYEGPFRTMDQNKIERVDWAHPKAFPSRLGCAALDVVVVPLANPLNNPFMKFNDFKSEIKWLEASAYKVPCVVQANAPPYMNCKDGDNAYTFEGKEEFLDKLDRLCKSKEDRTRIGQRAHDWTREYRDLDKNIHLWVEFYEKVVGERKWEKEYRKSPEVAANMLDPAVLERMEG